MTSIKRTPTDMLTAALVSLATNGQRPRCGDPGDHNHWVSEDPV